MQIKDIHLPPISTNHDTESGFEFPTGNLEHLALVFQARVCMKKGDYAGALEPLTKMLEMDLYTDLEIAVMNRAHDFVTRAECYTHLGRFAEAEADLAQVGQYASLSTEWRLDVPMGLLQQLQGKEALSLREAANRGEPFALLLLNEPESPLPPNPEWRILPIEERIKALMAGRHYTQAIAEINQMPPAALSCSTSSTSWIAARAACYALRGNDAQAILDYDEAHDMCFFAQHNLEKAVVYARAGQKEDALKLLEKEKPFFGYYSQPQELLLTLLRLQFETN